MELAEKIAQSGGWNFAAIGAGETARGLFFMSDLRCQNGTRPGYSGAMKTARIIAAVVVIAGGALIAFQQHRLSEVERKNLLLSREVQELKDTSISLEDYDQLKQENRSLQNLRAQADEVHKLRSEIARVREEKKRAEAALDQIAEANATLNLRLQEVQSTMQEQSSKLAETEQREQMQARMELRLQLGMQLSALMVEWADNNGGALPPNINTLLSQSQLPPETRAELINGYRMVPFKSLNEIQDRQRTVLFAGKEQVTGPQGERGWIYVFADGHSEFLDKPLPDGGIFPPER